MRWKGEAMRHAITKLIDPLLLLLYYSSLAISLDPVLMKMIGLRKSCINQTRNLLLSVASLMKTELQKASAFQCHICVGSREAIESKR